MDPPQMVSEVDSQPINQMTLKLPAYFDNVELWLSQVESVFNGSRPKITTEKTKYYLLISQLPGHILSLLADKIKPEEAKPYSIITDAIDFFDTSVS